MRAPLDQTCSSGAFEAVLTKGPAGFSPRAQLGVAGSPAGRVPTRFPEPRPFCGRNAALLALARFRLRQGQYTKACHQRGPRQFLLTARTRGETLFWPSGVPSARIAVRRVGKGIGDTGITRRQFHSLPHSLAQNSLARLVNTPATSKLGCKFSLQVPGHKLSKSHMADDR